MSSGRKEKLVELGADQLADASQPPTEPTLKLPEGLAEYR